MKQILRFSALLSALVLLVTACTKDETLEPQVTPAPDGSEILFGARAGFENAGDTRTVYSGETYTGTNGKTFERINWLDDDSDMIEIYCAEAAQSKTAHYIVKDASKPDDTDDATVDQFDEGYLDKLDPNASALQWKGDDVHTFYAMYPSSQYFENLPENNTLRQGVYMEKGVMHGFVPGAQTPQGEPVVTNGNYVYKPNMTYAYMAAKSTARREEGFVSLSFVPVITALQITLKIPATTTQGQASKGITISELQVEGSGIAGGFTANLDADANSDGYPDCTNLTGEGQALDVIQYTLGTDAVLAAGKSLTFTVFMRPGANIKDIKVRFSSTGAAYLTKSLQNINLVALRKNIVSAINLPAAGVSYDASNWMETLPDNFTMRRLSLPGTGGSFSSGYSGSNAAYYQQQTLPVTAGEGVANQWDAGIRAFEIISDRIGYSTATTLASAPVECNKTSVSINVATAMNMLIEKVRNSDECAVVVFTYQPHGFALNWDDLDAPPRNATLYAQSLKLWWDGLGDDQNLFIKYTPSLELGPVGSDSYNTTNDHGFARGNIMILVRLNQRHEKDDGSFADAAKVLTDCPFVLIDGCGTAKDRWGARGYKVNGYPMLDQSNSPGNYTYDGTNVYTSDMIIESYMAAQTETLGFSGNYGSTPSTYTNGTVTITRPAKDRVADLNFAFDTDANDATNNVDVWYQEWARVCESANAWSYETGIIFKETHYCHWFESYQEKLSNVCQTFNKAINDSTGNTIYINSLCGFYISSTPDDSFRLSTGSTYGGSGGDIAGLAADLNPAFADYVKQSGMEQTTGPTGVIFMDRVTADMEIIGRIIANNYKHSLQ